jgi:hypothetical protein
VEPFAGGKIDLDAEAFLDQSFRGHQVQGVEAPAGVIIDEKINVAFGIGLVAGG